jgi:hypothetical protein
MPLLFVVILFVFVDDDLFTPAMRLHSGRYSDSGQSGRANLHPLSASHH